MIRDKEFKNTNLNILLVGATGVGKSSTVNALFNMDDITEIELARVGSKVEPETIHAQEYQVGKVNLWDTPGFGDTKEKDKKYKDDIELILTMKDNNVPIIDLAIVILDGTSKDISTSIDLINTILIPNLGEEAKKRILIAINKIDQVKSGKYWDLEHNQPTSYLEAYLNKLINDFKSRIYDSTELTIDPIIYSAGNNLIKHKPYNLLLFINRILRSLPNEKRAIVIESTNDSKDNWEHNNKSETQRKETKEILREIFRTGLLAGISSFFGGFIFFDI